MTSRVPVLEKLCSPLLVHGQLQYKIVPSIFSMKMSKTNLKFFAAGLREVIIYSSPDDKKKNR